MARRKKPVLAWEGPVEGYVVNSLAANYFRVQRTMTREDYVQEAYCVYLRITARYAEVKEAKHLMALFKTAWSNRLTDLAHDDTAQRIFVPPPTVRIDDDVVERFEPIGELDNDGALAVAIREAPAEIRAVLSLLLAAPQEMLDAVLGSWRGRDRRTKAGGSERICKLLGLPQDRDILSEVEAYFTN